MISRRICSRFLSICHRNLCSQSAAETKENNENKHIFRTFNLWKDRSDFIENLLSNIIYDKDGLLVLNKPYGVGLQAPERMVSFSRNQVSLAEEYYLEDALPGLAAALGHTSLTVIKATERYSTGITLLAANPQVLDKIQYRLVLARRQDVITSSYYSICVGKPIDKEQDIKLGVKLDEVDSKRKLPILVDEWSKKAVKNQLVKTVLVQHRLLSETDNCSLVLIRPSRTKKYFIRLYMSSKQLAPILGDNICGSRVQTMLGVNILIDHRSSAAAQPQKIPNEILSQLNLVKSDRSIVPTHLHLGNMTIINYFRKGQDLKINAPLPQHFVWSCQQLGLNVPELLHTTSVE